MKKYVCPMTIIFVLSTDAILGLGLASNDSQVGEGEFGNRSSFEEDVSAEFDNSKSLWDD